MGLRDLYGVLGYGLANQFHVDAVVVRSRYLEEYSRSRGEHVQSKYQSFHVPILGYIWSSSGILRVEGGTVREKVVDVT